MWISFVSTTNNSNILIRETGDNVDEIKSGYWLQIGSGDIHEVKRTFVDNSVQKIELFEPFKGDTNTGLRVVAFAFRPNIQALTKAITDVVDKSEDIFNVYSDYTKTNLIGLTSSSEWKTELGLINKLIVISNGDGVDTIGDLSENRTIAFDSSIGRSGVGDTQVRTNSEMQDHYLSKDKEYLNKKIKEACSIFSDFSNNEYKLRNHYEDVYQQNNNLDDIWNISRNTSGWVWTRSGKLIEIPPNMPRISWNFETKKYGLLIEEQRTNEVAYSNDFTDETWSKIGIGTGDVPIVTSNFSHSPFVGVAATRLQCNLNNGTTTSDRSWLQNFISATTKTNRTVYFWVKSNTGLTQNFAIGQNNFTLRQATNEWTRVSITRPDEAALSARIGLIGGLAGQDDSIDILVCHAQAELGEPSSPIITNGTTVIRTADIPTRTLGVEFDDNRGTFTITADVKIGDVLLRCGSLAITADFNGEKTYTASYTSALNATQLEICPDVPRATVSQLAYKPTAE